MYRKTLLEDGDLPARYPAPATREPLVPGTMPPRSSRASQAETRGNRKGTDRPELGRSSPDHPGKVVVRTATAIGRDKRSSAMDYSRHELAQ